MNFILDLPAGIRKTLFAVIVVVVVGLTWYTLHTTGDKNDVKPKPTTQTTSANPTVVPQNTTQTQPQSNPTVGGYTDGVTLNLNSPVSQEGLQSAASKATHFAQLYLSYAYNQNNQDKQNELNNLLSNQNTIDFSKLFPDGPTQQQFVQTQTTVGVKVNKIDVLLISTNQIILNVTVTSTTTNVSDPPETSQDVFTATMTNEDQKDGWYVSGFDAEDDNSPFLDE